MCLVPLAQSSDLLTIHVQMIAVILFAVKYLIKLHAVYRSPAQVQPQHK